MLDMALKNVVARKTRTALVILGVAVCVFLINTVDGMLAEMNNSRDRDLQRQEGVVYLRQPGSGYPPFGSSLPETVAAEALARPGIDTALSSSLLLLVIVPAQDPMEPAQVAGVGITPGREHAYIRDTSPATGTNTLEGAPENAVILGSSAASYYDLALGDTLDVNGESTEVIGVLEQRKMFSIDAAVLMPLSLAQRAFAKDGLVSVALITPSQLGGADAVAADLATSFPRLETATQSDIRFEVDRTLQMPNVFMGTISWTVFIVAIVMLTNVMLVAVRERTKEIGTLSALGMRSGPILLTILYETLVITVAGGAIGLALTVPAAYLGDWTWILSYDEMFKVGFLILVAGAIAALYPAYRATRISPLEALRYE